MNTLKITLTEIPYITGRKADSLRSAISLKIYYGKDHKRQLRRQVTYYTAWARQRDVKLMTNTA